MLELLFLLLPLAAFYGWFMGSRSARSNDAEQQNSRTRSLTNGINYFLHRDKDKAVDEFIQYYNSENQHNFEESIALGALFRERGEMERAIEFHNSIMTMPDLAPGQRSLALIELAKDFMRSGLMDRAEEILKELISYNEERKNAVELLIQIYQQEKEWQQGLDTINRYRHVLNGEAKLQESMFICELANDEYLKKKMEQAKELFKKALAVKPDCVRAMHTMTRIYIDEQNYDKATAQLDCLAETEPDMVNLCVSLLNRCYPDNPDAPEKLELLRKWFAATEDESAASAIAEILFRTSGSHEAENFALNYLKKNGSAKLFARLLNYYLKELNPLEQERFAPVLALIEAADLQRPRFACQKCGFSSKMLFWYCPNCHHWDTMRPINSSDAIASHSLYKEPKDENKNAAIKHKNKTMKSKASVLEGLIDQNLSDSGEKLDDNKKNKSA